MSHLLLLVWVFPDSGWRWLYRTQEMRGAGPQALCLDRPGRRRPRVPARTRKDYEVVEVPIAFSKAQLMSRRYSCAQPRATREFALSSITSSSRRNGRGTLPR
jgi:hypothetical protein